MEQPKVAYSVLPFTFTTVLGGLLSCECVRSQAQGYPTKLPWQNEYLSWCLLDASWTL